MAATIVSSAGLFVVWAGPSAVGARRWTFGFRRRKWGGVKKKKEGGGGGGRLPDEVAGQSLCAGFA